MNNQYKNATFITCLLMAGCMVAVTAFTLHHDKAAQLHVIDIKNPGELKNFFHYTNDRIAFISSHRGGPLKGFPENCIATFENTLQQTWSLIELDPHYTKDSALVVMHDPTLDRTSNGHGKIVNYTLEELRKLKLKDTEGNVTQFGMSTLDEMLEWVKGKTIMVLDAKEVPIEVRAQKIIEHKVQANVILIAYSYEDAKKCYEIDKDIMMEVMMPDAQAIKRFDSTGVPWSNVVAFVTHTKPSDVNIFQSIHTKGAMCIMGSSRTADREYTSGKLKSLDELTRRYHDIIKGGADIIEADLGIEAGTALQKISPAKSSKQKYFKIMR
jgi:glycerophosphoryl diester phosphodiesterase